MIVMQLPCLVGKEIRDRFSGAVEAFSRRHISGSSPRNDHAKHRTYEEVPSSKEVVNFNPFPLFQHFLFLLV